MLSTNWLMYVPRRLKNSPDKTTEKRYIPVSRSLPPTLLSHRNRETHHTYSLER
jgi:hypothetical protein